jgi:hypothetical protein
MIEYFLRHCIYQVFRYIIHRKHPTTSSRIYEAFRRHITIYLDYYTAYLNMANPVSSSQAREVSSSSPQSRHTRRSVTVGYMDVHGTYQTTVLELPYYTIASSKGQLLLDITSQLAKATHISQLYYLCLPIQIVSQGTVTAWRDLYFLSSIYKPDAMIHLEASQRQDIRQQSVVNWLTEMDIPDIQLMQQLGVIRHHLFGIHHPPVTGFYAYLYQVVSEQEPPQHSVEANLPATYYLLLPFPGTQISKFTLVNILNRIDELAEGILTWLERQRITLAKKILLSARDMNFGDLNNALLQTARCVEAIHPN